MLHVARTWVGRFIGQIMAIVLVVAISFGALAADDRTHPIDIQPQPLSDALRQLSRQTGMQFFVDSALTEGLSAPRVTGLLSAEDALRQLLQGSGLSYRIANGEVMLVRKPQGAGPVQLSPILVEGELQTRTLQDTQTSVTVVTGEEFDWRGETDLYDMIERTPNVTQVGGEGGFIIRGIDQTGLGASNTSLAINTQIDGVAKPDIQSINRSTLPTWDVEQVEVLRGPQSTQQGPNALAGAVIIRTADPVYDNEYKIRGTYGSRDFYDLAFVINQVLSEDTLAFRLAAQTSKDDGWVENTTLGIDDADYHDFSNFRGKLLWNPDDRLEAILSYQLQQTDTGGIGGEVEDVFFPDERIITADIANEEELTEHTGSLLLSYDLSDHLVFLSETGYYTYDFEGTQDFGRTAVVDGFVEIDGSEAESFQQEFRLQFEGKGYRGVAGLFYLSKESTSNTTSELPGSRVGFPGIDVLLDAENTDEVENYAVFGEIDLEADRLLSGLSFTIGGRWDRESREISSVSDIRTRPTLPFPLPFPSQDVELDTDYKVFLPKIAGIYEWREGLTTSLTYQQGYRAGGARVSSLGGIREFDPEFLRNVEFAFRGEFMNRSLVTNANVFYSRWVDQQILVTNEITLDSFIDNAGESEMFGGELTINFRVSSMFDVYAAVGYLESEFLDYETTDGNFEGNALPGAPHWTGSFGGDYRFDNGISVGVDFSYTAESYTTRENDEGLTSDSRFLANANISYERGGLTAGAYVRNLFDVDYALERFDNPRIAGRDVFARTGEPLTLGTFIRYEF